MMRKTASKKRAPVKKAALPVEEVAESVVQPTESLPVAEVINKKRKISLQTAIIIVLMVLLIASAATAAYLYHKSQTPPSGQQQAEQLITQVGKLMDLPKGETPVIYSVKDVSQLKEPFFLNAKNGDKVLIYQQAKKAILYDPQADKIVNVGPLNIQAPTPNTVSSAGSVTPTKAAQVKVAIYNGTTTSGLAAKVEAQLKLEMPSVSVVTKTNAAKTDYKTTTVVDLSRNNEDATQMLASKLHGSVGNLPQGEQAPNNADIVVILGQ